MAQNFPYITVGVNNSLTQATINTSGSDAIPTMTNGTKPKYLHIKCFAGDAGDTYTVSPRHGAVAGDDTKGFPLSMRGVSEVILNVTGYSHIGWDFVTGSVGNGHLMYTPLEDF